MKIGNLKVMKNYSSGKTKWGIFGRSHKGVWQQTNMNGKDLVFNLQYDACGYLASLYEESMDREVKRKGYGYQPRSEEKVGA